MQLKVDARELARDIRAGMTESELIQKHKLPATALQVVCRKLLSLKLVTHEELFNGFPAYRSWVEEFKPRRDPRTELLIHLPIYDVEHSSLGIVRDISENGFRLAGISVAAGDVRTFQLPIDSFIKSDPLLIIAECRWTKKRSGTRDYMVAGFQILKLSQSDQKKLREFIHFLILNRSGEWKIANRVRSLHSQEDDGR